MSLGSDYLISAQRLFRYYQGLGEKAILQLNDSQINQVPDEHSNSIAIIVQHVHGNMLSRWTDFLHSDGEKPWRDREQEFEPRQWTKEALLTRYREGWDCVFQALASVQEENLSQVIYIRNEGHTVLEAINRQLAHYSYHIGQIVFLAKLFCSANWQSLSIPKGQSEVFNQQKFEQEKGRRHFI